MSTPAPSEEQILRKRAAALAAPLLDAAASEAAREVLQVRVGGARCAVPLGAVSSVVPIGEVAPLPGAPAHVIGLANLGGQVVTVVELGRLCGEASQPPRVALLIDTREGALALGVDRYEGVTRYHASEVLPPPREDGAGTSRFLDGVLAGGLGILNVERVLSELLGEDREDASETRRDS